MQRSTDPRDIVDDSPMTQLSGYQPAKDAPGASKSAEGVQEHVKDAVETAKGYGPDVVQKAKAQADAGLDTAAGGIESAASKLRERAGSDGVQAQAGAKVADTMERSADYLREHDSADIFDDVQRYVKAHPLQTAAGAVIGAFLLGRFLG